MELGARLRAFAAFVRRGSFTGAAEELRISQPAVSKHIAEMERDLGVKLIERRSRSLSAAGEFLGSHVLRAEEWVPSAPYHVLLYQAFGWDPPNAIFPLDTNAVFEESPVKVRFAAGVSASPIVKAIALVDVPALVN